MLLSIGMIVKNEEKYLRLALEAIKPILEQVDSELIIADTGSTDNTVAIAKEFTKNVFSIEWCNDFSAARNATLKKANGSWFMALDGDEVFEDTRPLIKFFNSGEYKKYNSATFVQRNFIDKYLKNSTDFNAPRLTKITKNTYYVNAIHERLTTYAEPIKIIPVIARHYGYISVQNDEFLKKKVKRNLDLLFPQLELNPKDCICLLNICQSYLLISDYDNALKYCEEGLKYAKELDEFIQFTFYFTKASIFYNTKQYENIFSTIKDYFESKSKNTGILATDMEMYFFKAECSYRITNYKDSIIAFKEYLNLVNEYRKGMLLTPDTMHHSINFTNDDSIQHAIFNLIDSYIITNDYDAAIKETISAFTQLAKNSQAPKISTQKPNKIKTLAELYEITDEKYRDSFQKVLENELEIEDCKSRILNEFAVLEAPHSNYAGLMKLRYDFGNHSITSESVQDFLENTDDWQPIYADALYFALRANIPVQIIASKVDAFDLDSNLFSSPHLHFNDLAEVIYQLCEEASNISEISDANANLWISMLYEWALCSQRLNDQQAEVLFLAYAKTSFVYLSKVFNTEILSEENACFIPKPLRAGFYCYLAAYSLQKEQTALYIKHLKNALCLKEGLRDVVTILRDKLQKRLDNEKTILSEFEQYAIKVKSNIAMFIRKGERENALKILTVYEELCPDDPEIVTFKAQLKTALK